MEMPTADLQCQVFEYIISRPSSEGIKYQEIADHFKKDLILIVKVCGLLYEKDLIILREGNGDLVRKTAE